MVTLVILIICLIFPTPLLGTGEFDVKQQIIYQVNPDGSASATQNIQLTNNISQIYAKDYQFNITLTNLQNIIASNQKEDLIESIEKLPDQTIIKLKFSNPTIGKDQTNQFYIRYLIPNFATKKGNTWEITLPSIQNKYTATTTSVTLDVPTTFGELSFASTPVVSTHTLTTTTQYRLNQSPAKSLLIFGDHQLFEFNLKYHLTNPQTEVTNFEIPLPPDTHSQDVIFSSIDPLPLEINQDLDGNWLAKYVMNPHQTIDVVVTGQAKVHPAYDQSTTIESSLWLQPQQFWPISDPQIIALSRSLSTPKSIYDYITQHLDYYYANSSSSQRQGAVAALNNPSQSLCTEFTDLFVTLARASQIPAREIEGYAYSNNLKIKPTNPNSDILHAWPEYYDYQTQQWRAIDPTWGKTTSGVDYFSDLDLNHLTFVIHGLSSQNPPPPGSYRIDPSTKSVMVEFASTEIKPEPKPLQFSIQKSTLSVHNPNLFALKQIVINRNNSTWTSTIGLIPPLGKITITLPSVGFWASLLPSHQKINLNYTASTFSNPVSTQIINQQYYLHLCYFIGFAIFLLCLGGIIITNPQKK